MCITKRRIAVSTAFLTAPLAPVLLHFPISLLYYDSIEFLSPMIVLCLFFGYLVSFAWAAPIYLLVGADKVPDFSVIVAFGTVTGSFLAILMIVWNLQFTGLEDDWIFDIQRALIYWANGMLYGTVSSLLFWLFAYSWRAESK